MVQKSLWFTRGWTLQELVAPRDVCFYDGRWTYINNRYVLSGIISQITNIDQSILTDGWMRSKTPSVAKRMSWAATRKTTRPEDIAYCLLGLFDVNMPLLYGEGGTKAFYRLQEEIMKNSADQSIFAWSPRWVRREQYDDKMGVLAMHPMEYSGCSGVMMISRLSRAYVMTNKGLQIDLPLDDRSNTDPLDGGDGAYWAQLACHFEGNFSGCLSVPVVSGRSKCARTKRTPRTLSTPRFLSGRTHYLRFKGSRRGNERLPYHLGGRLFLSEIIS